MLPLLCFHCSRCDRCVVFMDHHCPWINNCVGLYNQKPFLLFTFYASLTLAYGGCINVVTYNDLLFGQTLDAYTNWVMGVMALGITLQWMGFIFVLVVFCDQVVVIFNRMRIIDKVNLDLQRLTDGKVLKSGLVNWKRAFQKESLSFTWLLPTVYPKEIYWEQIYEV